MHSFWQAIPFCGALLSLSLLLTACHNTEQFHKPINPAEKTLNDVLKYSWDDSGFTSCVIKASECSKSQNNHSSLLLTEKLRESLAVAESKKIQRDCNGQYKEGHICGFDYNPIAGGQDYPPHYLYRTIKSDTSTAIIEKCFPSNNELSEATIEQCSSRSTYKMIINNEKWILDGINRGHESFNMENK